MARSVGRDHWIASRTTHNRQVPSKFEHQRRYPCSRAQRLSAKPLISSTTGIASRSRAKCTAERYVMQLSQPSNDTCAILSTKCFASCPCVSSPQWRQYPRLVSHSCKQSEHCSPYFSSAPSPRNTTSIGAEPQIGQIEYVSATTGSTAVRRRDKNSAYGCKKARAMNSVKRSELAG